MKRVNSTRIAILVASVVALLAVTVAGGNRLFAGDTSNSEGVTATFKVQGMTCGGCEVGVKRVVKKLDGVVQVKASHKKGTAEVTYEPEKVTTEQIVEAIETLGYTAELEVQGKDPS